LPWMTTSMANEHPWSEQARCIPIDLSCVRAHFHEGIKNERGAGENNWITDMNTPYLLFIPPCLPQRVNRPMRLKTCMQIIKRSCSTLSTWQWRL
jgi:hypothetical protein